MRMVFPVLTLLLALSAYAAAGKGRAAELHVAVERLDRALIEKDTPALNKLLAEQLKYGHSNGWVETKSELKTHLYDGKLSYRSITLRGKPEHIIEGHTGLVREEVGIDVLLDGNPVIMKLMVLQVWIFRKGGWVLIGRQSTKV